MVGGKAVDSSREGQEVANNKRRVERGDKDSDEREFAEGELRTLLYAPYPAAMDDAYREQLADALRISLLSGMRMAEVLTLWVEEVHDGTFDIQQGKTRSAALRWFMTEARHAGQPVETIKDVIGHVPDKKKDPIYAYARRASGEQMRKCIEATKLPGPSRDD